MRGARGLDEHTPGGAPASAPGGTSPAEEALAILTDIRDALRTQRGEGGAR
jgi:hypothetical protein